MVYMIIYMSHIAIVMKHLKIGSLSIDTMMSLGAAKPGANRLQLGFDIHGPDQQNHMHMLQFQVLRELNLRLHIRHQCDKLYLESGKGLACK
jgi:hypothetical protein